MFLNIISSIAWTHAVDNVFHTLMVIWENEYFLTTNLLCSFTSVKLCRLVILLSLIQIKENYNQYVYNHYISWLVSLLSITGVGPIFLWSTVSVEVDLSVNHSNLYIHRCNDNHNETYIENIITKPWKHKGNNVYWHRISTHHDGYSCFTEEKSRIYKIQLA